MGMFKLLLVLLVVGMGVMFWVGGYIVFVGSDYFGWYVLYCLVYYLDDYLVGFVGGVLIWLVSIVVCVVIGLVIGIVVVVFVYLVCF